MDHRAPLRDIDSLFRRINRMSAEAEWDRDELRDEINSSAYSSKGTAFDKLESW